MISHASRRVAWGMHRCGRQPANCKRVAICKQMIKLRSVTTKLRLCIEQIAENVLDVGNVGANANLPAKFIVQIGSS